MSFLHWLRTLQNNALNQEMPLRDLQQSTFAKLCRLSDYALFRIYSENVEPTVEALVEWASACPDALEDRRELEVAEEFAA